MIYVERKNGKVVATYRWPQKGKQLETLPDGHREVVEFQKIQIKHPDNVRRQEAIDKLLRENGY